MLEAQSPDRNLSDATGRPRNFCEYLARQLSPGDLARGLTLAELTVACERASVEASRDFLVAAGGLSPTDAANWQPRDIDIHAGLDTIWNAPPFQIEKPKE